MLENVSLYLKKLNLLDVIKPFTLDELDKSAESAESNKDLADKIIAGTLTIKMKLYEVSQTINCVKWIRVEADSKEEAIELASNENFWNETELTADGPTEAEEIGEGGKDL